MPGRTAAIRQLVGFSMFGSASPSYFGPVLVEAGNALPAKARAVVKLVSRLAAVAGCSPSGHSPAPRHQPPPPPPVKILLTSSLGETREIGPTVGPTGNPYLREK